MKELIKMWENTRMIVLVALTAGLYAGILIPFKVAVPIIPGFTELRPANVIPIICSLMFGPAAAWGSAIGNLIADFFGTLGLGSIFGFIGNFLYGFIPYKLWRGILKETEPDMKSAKNIIVFIFVSFIASLNCALIIGWGVDLLGLVPFSALGNIIFLNNFIVSIILGPIILGILYPRVKKWGLLYTQILKKEYVSSHRLQLLGMSLIIITSIIGFLLGNFISIGIYKSGFLAFGFTTGIKGEIGLSLGLLPFIIIILLSILLL